MGRRRLRLSAVRRVAWRGGLRVPSEEARGEWEWAWLKRSVCRWSSTDASFYRAMLSICSTSHGPVSVRLSQVGVLSKRLNESSWFLARELPSTRRTLC